ncbi:hypothetical protein [Litchfieldia alkalitelluris]|uniref:hypothetical protein n=1 Tax=Litchfieldia alkalitelluris TaxID=304268 RepID=UPI001475C152|nr:hypothetical protein [Litchfieldia alkalitelluris]
MEVNMSAQEVLMNIQQLRNGGSNLNKKSIKKTNPQLMRNALHYFSDWTSAVEKSNSL